MTDLSAALAAARDEYARITGDRRTKLNEAFDSAAREAQRHNDFIRR